MIRWDQVNLLVYGLDRPYFKQKKKTLANWIFLIYYFLLFEEKNK